MVGYPIIGFKKSYCTGFSKDTVVHRYGYGLIVVAADGQHTKHVYVLNNNNANYQEWAVGGVVCIESAASVCCRNCFCSSSI